MPPDELKVTCVADWTPLGADGLKLTIARDMKFVGAVTVE
jgi:hypothetical protein